LKDFGELFLADIKNFLAVNQRRRFADHVKTLVGAQRRPCLNDSQAETLRRFQAGESVEQIARARGFVHSTIYGHLLAAIECGKLPTARKRFFAPAQEKEIAAAFRQIPDGKLIDVSAFLGGKYDISLLRIFGKLAGQTYN
jgi:hypothetical protein